MVAQLTRDYELLMIISPEANEEEVTTALERVTNFITGRGGSIIDQSNWGLRRLAYPIQNFHEGNYVLTRFSADTSDIIELDNSLKASEDILRHLTTKIDKSVNLTAAKAKAAEPPEEEVSEAVDSVETASEEEKAEEPSEAVDSVEAAEPAESSAEVSEAVDSIETAEEEKTEEPAEAVDSDEAAEPSESEEPSEAVDSVETAKEEKTE